MHKKRANKKKGQLLGIEIHYFLLGFGLGLILSLVLVLLGSKKIIPFKIPVVCGWVLPFLNKKAQLEILEAKEFFIGFAIGFIAGLILTYLGTIGILPFKIPLVCG